jgi:hypothetical protein
MQLCQWSRLLGVVGGQLSREMVYSRSKNADELGDVMSADASSDYSPSTREILHRDFY